MVKKIIIAVIAIIFLAAGGLIYKYEKDQQALKEHYEALAAQLEPYNRELRELKSQLNQMENDKKVQSVPDASVQILFDAPVYQVYEEASEMLTQKDFSAMLGVSLEAFPGKDTMMTIDQCQELLDLGWTLCLVWDGQTALPQWLDEMNQLLSESGLTSGAEGMSVYVQDPSGFSDGYEILLSYGCTGVIEEKEAESVITKDPEVLDGLWCAGAYAWSGSGGSDLLSGLISEGGNLIFCVDWTEKDTAFSTRQFEAMLEAIDQYRSQGKLKTVSLDEAMETQMEFQENYENNQKAYEKKIKELKQLIEEKQEEMDALLER